LYEPELERMPRHRDTAGGWTWLRPGTGRGALLGGEITLIPELIGRFELSLRSKVLFWHVGYHGLPLQQLFKKLCDKADVTSLAGMIVGAHPVFPPAEWAGTVAGLLDEFLSGSAFPVVVNADLSHLCPSWTVPFGEEAILEAPDRIVFPRRPIRP
jgi:muramoyltetrapeptide carboxypeptidase LdcA involved in peptidoglycan recycling